MTTLEAAQQLCLVRGYVFGDTGFVARFLRGWRSFALIGRPSGFPGVTEYAGRNASVRSASVIRFHLGFGGTRADIGAAHSEVLSLASQIFFIEPLLLTGWRNVLYYRICKLIPPHRVRRMTKRGISTIIERVNA